MWSHMPGKAPNYNKNMKMLHRAVVFFALNGCCVAYDFNHLRFQKDPFDSESPSTLSSESPSTSTTTPPPTPVCPVIKEEITLKNYINPFDFPPGYEYLGIGYDILRGNPRGDETLDFDQGFRFPILDLQTKPGKSTTTRGYKIPPDSYLKGVKLCQFESQASELSSGRDYQKSLQKESTVKHSGNVGLSGYGFNLSIGFAHSKSEKYAKFEQKTQNEASVTFENKATCIEYEIGMHPFAPATFDSNFLKAVKNLPDQYNETDPANEKKFSNFYDAYGTHYVNKLSMGGKWIITSEMSSFDSMQLARTQVDVATTLSFDVALSMGEDAFSEAKRKEKAPKICCRTNETLQSQYDPPTANLPNLTMPLELSLGYSMNRESKETKTSKSIESVKSKVVRQSMYTIGGGPPKADGRWQSWAETVKDNPMPVQYEQIGFWDLKACESNIPNCNKTTPFTEEKQEAYFQFIMDKFKIDLSLESPFGKSPGVRFGTAKKMGGGISKYSSSSDKNYRAFLKLQSVKAVKAGTQSGTIVPVPSDADGKGTWTRWAVPPLIGYYACGMRVKWDPASKNEGLRLGLALGLGLGFGLGLVLGLGSGLGSGFLGDDDMGMNGAIIKFCSLQEWSDQTEETVYMGDRGLMQEWAMCPEGTYIVQIKPYVPKGRGFLRNDLIGIDHIQFACADDQGVTPQQFYNDNSGFQNTVKKGKDEWDPPKPAQPQIFKPGWLISSIRVRHSSNEGINSLEVKMEKGSKGGGPSHSLFFYDLFWETKNAFTSAIFSNAIRGKNGPHKKEDLHELGFVVNGEFNIETTTRYGLMTDPLQARIAVSDFKDKINEEDLSSFTFLAIENLPSSNHTLISGVVHPDMHVINKGNRNNVVSVSAPYKDEPNVFNIAFENDNMENATFLVFPMWFPETHLVFPTKTDDVTVAVRSAQENSNSFDVVLGSKHNIAAEKHLGFSFLALEHNYKNEGADIIYGNVIMDGFDINREKSSWSNDAIVAETQFSNDKIFRYTAGLDNRFDMMLVEQQAGGVLIQFHQNFTDIPSVIVSPIMKEEENIRHDEIDLMYMPHTVLEYVTESEVFIKAGMIDTTSAGVNMLFEDCDEKKDIDQTLKIEFVTNGEIKFSNNDGIEYCMVWGSDDKVVGEECKGGDHYKKKDMWAYDGVLIHSMANSSMCLDIAVRCGGHIAPSCEKCPYDDDGNDRGKKWCNGDCRYKNDQCITEEVGNIDKVKEEEAGNIRWDQPAIMKKCGGKDNFGQKFKLDGDHLKVVDEVNDCLVMDQDNNVFKAGDCKEMNSINNSTAEMFNNGAFYIKSKMTESENIAYNKCVTWSSLVSPGTSTLHTNNVFLSECSKINKHHTHQTWKFSSDMFIQTTLDTRYITIEEDMEGNALLTQKTDNAKKFSIQWANNTTSDEYIGNRIKLEDPLEDPKKCFAWEDDPTENQKFVISSVFKPLSFGFMIIAPKF